MGGFAVSGVRTGVAPLFHPATDGFAVSRVQTGDLAIMLRNVLLGLTTFSALQGMKVMCCSSLDEEDGRI